MHAHRNPAVVRDGIEAQIPVGLIGEADLGFEIAGEQTKVLQAGAIPVQDRSCR